MPGSGRSRSGSGVWWASAPVTAAAGPAGPHTAAVPEPGCCARRPRTEPSAPAAAPDARPRAVVVVVAGAPAVGAAGGGCPAVRGGRMDRPARRARRGAGGAVIAGAAGRGTAVWADGLS